jgi:hypothetical protein
VPNGGSACGALWQRRSLSVTRAGSASDYQLAVVGAGDPDVAAVGELQKLLRPIVGHNEVTSPSLRNPGTFAICSGGGFGGSGRRSSPRASRSPRRSIGHLPSLGYSGTARWPGQPGSAQHAERGTRRHRKRVTGLSSRLSNVGATNSNGEPTAAAAWRRQATMNLYLRSSAARRLSPEMT